MISDSQTYTITLRKNEKVIANHLHRLNPSPGFAERSQTWQDALTRHGLTYDELAKRLQELVYSSDSRTSVQALKLAMQSADLLREKPAQAVAATSITINVMQPTDRQPAEKPVVPILTVPVQPGRP